ncbi:V-type ATP synthase subunit I [Candidatus Aerophobetes bacterium]|nr:V-type ATP synthase subunit I [Candidatus Aerophobetes bacterium]
MAIADMTKVLLIGEKDLRDNVVKKLAEVGIFQPSPLNSKKGPNLFKLSEVKREPLQDNLNKIERAINFLNRFEEKKFDLGLFPSKLIIEQGEYSRWIKNSKWEESCKRCSEIEEEVEKIKEQIGVLQDNYKNLLPWRKISFPLKKLETLKYIAFQLAIIPSEEKDVLQEEAKKQACYVWLLEEMGRKVYVLLIFLKEQRPKIEKMLQKFKGEKVTLREDVAPSVKMQKIRVKQNDLQKTKEKILNEAKELAREKTKLMVVYDYFYDVLKERDVYSNTGMSRYTFCLEGWIRKEDIPSLKNALKSFPRVEAVVTKPEREDLHKIPVALSNRKIFKPFELITELYGLPRYVEIDPTPLLAPFFAVFLAICLTDGGYGILMAILAFLIPRKIQVGEGGKKLFSMLFISGLVTIVVGALTGGIFGIQLQELPAALAPLKKLTLINPMQEPMVFLVIVLMLGVVHLLTGIILEMKDNLRKGKISAAFLDQFSWVILIIGLLLAAVPFGKGFFSGETGSSATGLSLTLSPSQFLILWKDMPIYSKVGSILAIGGAITLFVFTGRKSKNIGKRLAKGAYEIYGIIQIFADVLSYSRLLALGLATSVIATVVNTIAGMAGGIPILGPVAIVFILILGHIGNLLINTLSGFIHTSRLQFVEFFTKFYEGGGQKFEPLKREGKYTIIKETLKQA